MHGRHAQNDESAYALVSFEDILTSRGELRYVTAL
jgi:hypothetical protein